MFQDSIIEIIEETDIILKTHQLNRGQKIQFSESAGIRNVLNKLFGFWIVNEQMANPREDNHVF